MIKYSELFQNPVLTDTIREENGSRNAVCIVEVSIRTGFDVAQKVYVGMFIGFFFFNIYK